MGKKKKIMRRKRLTYLQTRKVYTTKIMNKKKNKTKQKTKKQMNKIIKY